MGTGMAQQWLLPVAEIIAQQIGYCGQFDQAVKPAQKTPGSK
jgi:hypothetical protein